jgi:SNARE protein 1
MAVSQLEVNFTRLLARCEGMAADKKFLDWRLDKYLIALDEMLVQLSNIPPSNSTVTRPPPDMIAAYKKKVDFLKNLLTTEKLTNAGEKAVLSSQLLGGSHTGPLQATAADQTLGKTTELQLAAKARVTHELREELLGNRSEQSDTDSKPDEGETKSGASLEKSGMTSEDLDQVMQHHRNAQVGIHFRTIFYCSKVVVILALRIGSGGAKWAGGAKWNNQKYFRGKYYCI